MRHIDNEEMLLANGFDSALIGNCSRTFRAIYRLSTMIDILVTDEGMDYVEAREYLDFNVIGAYVGDSTPIYLNDIDVV